jgi:hypothetical protein
MNKIKLFLTILDRAHNLVVFFFFGELKNKNQFFKQQSKRKKKIFLKLKMNFFDYI